MLKSSLSFLPFIILLLILGSPNCAFATLSQYGFFIQTRQRGANSVFETCEESSLGPECDTIGNPTGYSREDLRDVTQFCQGERLIGPMINIFTSSVFSAGVFAIGITIGAAGGPVGSGLGAIIGSGAGAFLARRVAPPVNARDLGEGLRYIRSIQSECEAKLSLSKIQQISNGLKSCLDSFARYESQHQYQLRRQNLELPMIMR